MQINVEIKNLDKVKAALNQYPTIAAKHFDRAIKSSIFKIEREAKGQTPVDTGRLRNSYTSIFSPLKGILEPTADYAFWVHEGTRRMTGRPFLQGGIEAADSTINQAFDKALTDTLNEVAGNV